MMAAAHDPFAEISEEIICIIIGLHATFICKQIDKVKTSLAIKNMKFMCLLITDYYDVEVILCTYKLPVPIVHRID